MEAEARFVLPFRAFGSAYVGLLSPTLYFMLLSAGLGSPAYTLGLEPSVLLMDEPCSALDPISSAVVEQLIQSLRGRYTIVIVTHNLAQAKRIANYAAFFWMKERVGKLIEFGSCRPLFDTPLNPLTAAYVSGISG